MMLSMVPAVGATEVSEAAEPEITVEETISNEDLAREIEAAQFADAAKLTDEEIAKFEEVRRARVEAELANVEIPLDEIHAMPESDALAASATGEYTINVTLEFSSAATRDTRINIDVFDNTGYFGHWYDVDVQTLKKGADSLKFSVPVDKGSYNMELYGQGSSTGWMYADIYGALSNEWDNRLYIGAFGNDKTIDVVIDGDQLLKTNDDEDGPAGSDVAVTVKLPAKTTGDCRYRTFLRSGNSTQESSQNIASGKTSYTQNMNTTFSTFVVGYYDATNIDSWWNARYASGVRYLAEDGGITSQFSEAKVFTASETSSVTIDDTDNYAMTGKLKLESEWKYDKGMYAFAEFENGECYAGRAYFPAGTTSAEYTIYIPKGEVNSKFTHWAAETEDWNSNRIMETSYLEGKEYTLTKSGTLSDITLPDPPVTVKGTFSLPAGMKAPSGGMNVVIQVEDQSEWYNLPAGKSSFDFELTPVINENQEYTVWAYIENAPDNLCDQFRNRYMGSELMDVDMTAYETVIVSGSLEVPDACKEKGSTIRLYAYTNVDTNRWYNYDLYISVLPGQTSAAYEIKALKGYEDSYVSANVEADATGKLLTTEMYLQEDGTTGTNNRWFALTKNMSDVDFVYALGKSISGKVTLAAGLDAGYYYGEVSARPTEGGGSYRTNFYFDGTEGSYALAVPQDYTGSYRVYYSIYSDENPNALTDCQVYYSTTGMTTDSSKASKITVPEEGAENIDLVILKAKFITGTITVPTGLPADAEYRGNVTARNVSTNASYNTYFEFIGTKGTYSLGIPADESGSFRIYIYMYNDGVDGVMTGQNYYWSSTGMTADSSKASSFTVTDDGASVDLIIPKGIMVTGNVSLSAGLPANGGYDGWVGLQNENGTRYTGRFDFGEGNTSYSVSLPADYTGTYTVILYLYEEEGVTPDNLITYTYLYLKEDGTFSTSKQDAKKFTIGEAGLTQNVVIPAGQICTINLSAPAGFSGDYNGYVYLKNVTADRSNSYDFSFSGTSGSVSFTTLAGDTSEYTLRIYVYNGPGAMTGNQFYYANGIWVKSSDAAIPFTLSSTPLSVSLPAGKTITGKLVAADGSAINLGTNDNGNYGYISLSPISGSYLSSSYVVNANGTFSVTIPEDATGTYSLYFSPRDNTGCNVVSEDYFYVADATTSTTDSGKATAIDVSGEIPALTVLVDTGYVLTGTVELGEGATLDGVSSYNDGRLAYVDLRLISNEEDEANYFYESTDVNLYKNETSWSYTMVVPKKDATYTLEVYRFKTWGDSITSNIYDGEQTISDSIAVSASQTTLPTIKLTPAKTTISANITNPVATSASGYVYLVADDARYEQYFNINAGETKGFDFKISPTETAEIYTMYYYLYSPTGLYRYTNIYVVEDNKLSLSSNEAGNFAWDKTSVEFTLMEIPPFAAGKVYIPDYEDENFYLTVDSNISSSSYMTIYSSDVKTDSDGKKYVEYILADEDVTPGQSYYLYFEVEYDKGLTDEELADAKWSTSRYYITADGGVTTKSSERGTFTVPETMLTVHDLTLVTWDEGSENNVLQSDHGFALPETSPTFTYSYPGASYLEVTFDDRTDVYLNINGSYAGRPTGTRTINTSDTNGTMTITFDLNQYYYEEVYYGFGIVSIVPYYSSETVTAPAVATIYTDNGSDTATVMNDLRAGEDVHVTLVAPADSTGTLMAAVYDSTGKMIDMVMENVTFTNGAATSTLDFTTVDTAAKLQIMLVNNTTGLAPQMTAKAVIG